MEETKKRYLYMFTEGGGGHCIAGTLYECDHEIDLKEWKDLWNEYGIEEARLRALIPNANSCINGPDMKSVEYKHLVNWMMKSVDIEGDFIKLHNMREIKYTLL